MQEISNWITEDNSGESGERQPKVGVGASEAGTLKQITTYLLLYSRDKKRMYEKGYLQMLFGSCFAEIPRLGKEN